VNNVRYQPAVTYAVLRRLYLLLLNWLPHWFIHELLKLSRSVLLPLSHLSPLCLLYRPALHFSFMGSLTIPLQKLLPGISLGRSRKGRENDQD
jgi:hypothetical protein